MRPDLRISSRSQRIWGASVVAEGLRLLRAGHLPSRVAVSTFLKLNGLRLQTRRPFLLIAPRHSAGVTVDNLLRLQQARTSRFTFLVVGAFDGLTNDPVGVFLRDHDGRGVFVEPQPEACATLRAAFPDPRRFGILQAAVAATSGVQVFYRVDPACKDLPAWTRQIASLDPTHLRAHEAVAPGLAHHVIQTEVSCLSFDDLLDRTGIRRLDLLQIDAEGLDGVLLDSFPLRRMRPGLILYEIAHMRDRERTRVRNRLRRAGYMIVRTEQVLDEAAYLP